MHADGPAVGVGGASVIPGADLAMAFMEDGKVVKWLGRVAVIYKEKAIQGELDSKNKPVLSTQSARSALKNKNRAYWGAQNRRIRTASTIHSK